MAALTVHTLSNTSAFGRSFIDVVAINLMKTVYQFLFFGFAVATAGFILEVFAVRGFCHATGYCYLRKFDTLFYAFHSKKAVIAVVFFMNVALGFSVSYIVTRCFRK